MTQQISPFLAPIKADCPPAEKKTKEACGSTQLHGNGSEDKTNMSVVFGHLQTLSAPADEK